MQGVNIFDAYVCFFTICFYRIVTFQFLMTSKILQLSFAKVMRLCAEAL
jgi:hypothetical protein